MRSKIFQALAVVSSMLLMQQLAAAPFAAPDPRSMAMGGTGVASGTTANASFYNPALLAATADEDDFALEFPIIGFSVADPKDLVTGISDIVDNGTFGNLTTAIGDFNTAFNTLVAETPTIDGNGDATGAFLTAVNGSIAANTQMVAAVDGMINDLNGISNKDVQLQFFGGTVIGIPSRKLGVSVYAGVSGLIGGFAEFTQQDQTSINGISTQVDALSAELALSTDGLPGTNPNLGALTAVDVNTVTNMTTYLESRFVVIAEGGVSVARRFNVAGQDVAIGITPKYMDITIYDQRFVASELDTAELDSMLNETKASAVNVDLGLAAGFDNGVKVGLVLKNLIPQDIATGLGDNKISLNTQARAGIMYENSWLTVAADADLMENDPIGYEAPSQYVSVGAELDAFNFMQVRAGYRTNLSTSNAEIVTVGAGLSPFGLHLDVALTVGAAREVGGAAQLGFRF